MRSPFRLSVSVKNLLLPPRSQPRFATTCVSRRLIPLNSIAISVTPSMQPLRRASPSASLRPPR